MEYKPNDKEHEAVIQLPAPKRYEQLIKRVADWGTIWSLASDEGWVVMGDDGGQKCLPVWPHSSYALEFATGQWADANPQAITLEEWLENWLPGLERDGRSVAVFPLVRDKGAVVTPSRMKEDLLDYLRTWYGEE